jgi:aquaporin Z
MKRLTAEFLGTFGLVFAGTGAIVANNASHGEVTHVGVAMTFGLIVLAMIYTFGDVSGAHLNPAVTVAFAVARRFGWREVPGYMAAQTAGAFAASALLRILFPHDENLGATLPTASAAQSFILEAVLTFLLMLVILSKCFDGCQRKGDHRWNRHWRSHWSGSNVRRANLWGLDESGPLAGSGCCQRPR